jgi:putative Holliday junction resolvase
MPIGLLTNIVDKMPGNAVLLGMDVGKKTIGLALSDPDHSVATPLTTIKRVKFTQDVAEIRKIIAEYEVGGYVMGLPVNMDGTEGPRCQSVRDFAAEFARQLSGDPWIAFWDERLSTHSVEEAVDSLVEKRKTRVNAKASGLIDRLAAQHILMGALDYIQAQ